MNRDKARILKVISDVIDASRQLEDEKRRLTRNKLLVLMNERRPFHLQLSRDEFQNYFTTRVDRKSIVPVEDLICLIEVILEHYADCVTADAILELCDAARLPLREYRRISKYFSVAQWDKAWKLYDAATSSTFQGELVFPSREGLVRDITQQFIYKKVVVLSGYSGMGKTQLGLRICAAVELESYRICVMNGHDIHSIESFVVQLSNYLQLRPFGNESPLQRLQYYAKDNPMFVFIDDVVLSDIDDIYALLNHLSRLFPDMLLFVTTPVRLPENDDHPVIHSVFLEGLNYGEAQLLFRQSCYQLGSFAIDMALLSDQLSQCDGNPMAIKMLAYAASQSSEYIAKHHHLNNTMESLTENENYIIRLLTVFDSFISVDFLSYVSGLNDEVLSSSMNTLIHKGLITLHKYNLLMCHAPVRVWISNNKIAQTNDIKIEIVKRLYEIHGKQFMLPHFMIGIQRGDIDQLLSVMRRLINRSDVISLELIVSLLVKWRWFWCVMGYESEVLSICVQLIAKQHRFVHDSMFMLLRAMLYWRCEDIELARSMLTTIEVSATMDGNLELLAQAKFEMALTYMPVRNQLIFMTYMRQAQQLFERLEMRDWRNFTILQQASFLVDEGDFEKALEYQHEVEGSAQAQHSYMQYLLVYLRMKTYFFIGEYDIAHKNLILAQQLHTQLNISVDRLGIQVYAWVIHHFQQRDKKVESYNSAWKLASQLTHISLILLFADLLIFVLFEDEHIEQAMIVYRIASYFRNESSMSRMPYIDTLFEQKIRASMILYNPLHISVEMNDKMSVYEMIAHLKQVLNQLASTASRLLSDT